MQRTTILALTLVSFGLSPLACTRNFNFFAASMGTGGTAAGSSSSSGGSASASSSSSSGTGATGGGTPTGCTTNAQCDDKNPCTTDTCNMTTGTCAHANVADGPVPGYTPPTKNCETENCSSGMVVTVADDTNVPTSPTPCEIDSCSMMNVVMTAADAGVTCGTNQVCDGKGNCVGCTQDSDCPSPGPCKSVTCKVSNHTCVVANAAAESMCSGAAGAKVCDSNGNCVACVANTDCTIGTCQAGACVLAANGAPCTTSGDCTNGHCVQGICCSSACTSTCMACTAALTGGTDGTCGIVSKGMPPAVATQCAAAPPCGNTGKCNGSGACEQEPATTACGGTCDGGTEVPAGLCSGTGTCVSASMTCGAYVCNAAGSGCLSTCTMGGNADCATGYYCDPGTNTCLPGIPGAPCVTGAQCTSTVCLTGDGGVMTCM